MGKKDEKTNVMRILDHSGISYRHYALDNMTTRAEQVAEKLGTDPQYLYKTLVTVAKSGQHYIFMVPATAELDLKKAARAVGEKSIDMLPQRDLLPLTGYVHGGCSPIGMKKLFPTTIHTNARCTDSIFFSAGKIGRQVNMSPADLERLIPLHYCDITK